MNVPTWERAGRRSDQRTEASSPALSSVPCRVVRGVHAGQAVLQLPEAAAEQEPLRGRVGVFTQRYRVRGPATARKTFVHRSGPIA